MAFKCTAGLHNAVRHTAEDTGFEHHGFLNVLLATRASLDGAAHDELVELLDQRDGEVLAARARELSDDQAASTRRWFTSFGSCSIDEPRQDLTTLGLMGLSWIDIPDGSPFGPENLPLGVFRHGDEEPRVGAAIGDQIIDLAPVASVQMLDGAQLFAEPTLNAFLALGRPAWRATRNWLLDLVRNENDRDAVEPHLIPQSAVTMQLPFEVARLRRLLRLRTARVEPRPAVPPGLRAAAAELEAPARRLPRPGRHHRCQRHRHRPPFRPAQGPGRRGTDLRPVPAARHRGRARLRRRYAVNARKACFR